MPRARTATDSSFELPPPDDFDQDPEPAAAKAPRARRASTPRKATGTRGKIPARTPAGRVMSKAQMTAKVKEDLYAIAAMIVAGAELKDPCASMWWEPVKVGGREEERLAAFVDRLSTIIARNDRLLVLASSGGLLFDIVQALTLAVPVGVAMYRVHGPGGTGHGEEHGSDDYAERYPAPALR